MRKEVGEGGFLTVDRRTAAWDLAAGPANYTVLVCSQGAALLCSLATTWLISRGSGAQGLGTVAAVLAASQLLALLSGNWHSLSMWRYGCEEYVTSGSVASAFWSRMALLFPGLLLVAASAPLWMTAVSSWFGLPAGFTILIVAHLIVTASWLHVQQALQAAKLPRYQAGSLMAERALTLATIALLYVFTEELSLPAVVTSYIVPSLGVTLMGLHRLRRLILPVPRVDFPMLNKLLKFSLPLLPFSLFGYLTTSHLDAFFIIKFMSPYHLGLYAVAAQGLGIVMQLPTLAGQLILPYFITLDTAGGDITTGEYFENVLPVVCLAWTVICAGAAICGGWLVVLVFGREFALVGSLLWPLMIAACAAAPVVLGFGALSNARAQTHMSTVTAGIGAVCNVVLNIVLIPRYGLAGCAWATAIGYLASSAAWAYYGRNLTSRSAVWVTLILIPMIFGALLEPVAGGLAAFGLTLAVAFASSLLLSRRIGRVFGRFSAAATA